MKQPVVTCMRLLLMLLALSCVTKITNASMMDEIAPVSGPVVAPYAWATSIDGAIGFNGFSVPLNLQTTELLRGVKYGGMGYVQLPTRKGFWYLEGLGIDFGQKQFAPFFNQSVKASLYMGEIGYGWNFDVDTHFPVAGNTTLSPYLGARRIALKATIDGPLLHQSVSENWLDPVFGIIVQGPLYKDLSYIAKIDGGGFNTQNSDYRSIAAVLRYAFDAHWAVAAGYRASHFDGTDTSGSGFALNINGKGPLVGLSYAF